MLLITIFSRPCLKFSFNFIKIAGDSLILLFFVLLFGADKYYNENFLIDSNGGRIDEDVVARFNNLGWSLVVITFIFNAIYIMKFGILIKDAIIKLKEKEKIINENKKKDLENL